jgi:hypothetical protein
MIQDTSTAVILITIIVVALFFVCAISGWIKHSANKPIDNPYYKWKN